MNFAEYQEKAKRTSGEFINTDFWILVSGCGLTGEAGEVADYLKKVYGHGHQLDKDKLALELGDVLWYVADLASKHGLDLETIADKNIEKLKKRYPDGFSKEASKNRSE